MKCCRHLHCIFKGLDMIEPLVSLFARVYIARVFLLSGLSKIDSWYTTVLLFQNEYAVPLLSPELAAYLGTAAEIVLPVFISFGVMLRPSLLALFLFNIVAVISYPYLFTPEAANALLDHIYWGIIIALLATRPVNCLSIDFYIKRRYCQ